MRKHRSRPGNATKQTKKERKAGKDGKEKGRGKGKDVQAPNKPKGPKGGFCF